MRRGLFTIALLLATTGCTDFPDLDAVVSERARTADYPRITPLDQLLAAPRAQQGAGAGLGNLPARLSRLRARAHAMQARPVIDAQTRARLMAALARHN